MYFSNSHESRDFPTPAIPMIETSRARRSSAEAWKSSLTRWKSRSRPTNGASSPTPRPRPRRVAITRSGRNSLDRLSPALHQVPARALVGDCGLGRPAGRSTDQHGSGLGQGLDPGCGVHEVSGDQALSAGVKADCGLSRHHSDAEPQVHRAELIAERADRCDQIQCSAHRPLGVVLLGYRGAPDRHHRVSDEFLDAAAVPLDEPSGDVEVAREQVAHVLGVAMFREVVKPTRSANSTDTRRRSSAPPSITA